MPFNLTLRLGMRLLKHVVGKANVGHIYLLRWLSKKLLRLCKKLLRLCKKLLRLCKKLLRLIR